jgi:hypothetical protein
MEVSRVKAYGRLRHSETGLLLRNPLITTYLRLR